MNPPRQTDHGNSFLTPMLGSLSSTLTKYRRVLIPEGFDKDGALGTAATLGLSLAILRLAVSLYKALKLIDEPTVTIGDLDSPIVDDLSDTSPEKQPSVVGRVLRRILLGETTPRRSLAEKLEIENDDTVITHHGSCHCGSVRFEVLATRHLRVKDGPGKIQYRHTQVGSECFRVTSGKNFMQSYYVATDGTNYHESKSAHAFCGRCGVHILYAPSKNSSAMEVNVNCFDDVGSKHRVVSKTDTIAEGLPAESQWDEQLTPISEDNNSTVGFEFRLQNLYDDTRSTHSMFAKRSPFVAAPYGPATQSTTGSITDSYISSVGQGLGIHIETEHETSSVISGVSNPGSSVARSASMPLPSTSSASEPKVVSSPQTRDQMLRYMKKHLSSPPGRSFQSPKHTK